MMIFKYEKISLAKTELLGKNRKVINYNFYNIFIQNMLKNLYNFEIGFL